jgi:hypothetical protein
MYVAKRRGSGYAVAFEPGMQHDAVADRRARPVDAGAPVPMPVLSPRLT